MADKPEAPLVIAAVDLLPQHLELLEAHFRVVVLGSGGLPKVAADDLRQARALLVNTKAKVTADVIKAAPDLRIVATQSIGFDHVDIDAAVEAGVEVSTSSNRRDALAAIVFTHILMLSRDIHRAMAQVSEGRWSQGIMGSDLDGAVLFLIGFGGTARHVVPRALAFNMKIIAYDIRPPADVPAGVEFVESLEAGLAAADWVSLHVDLNPHTHHLIGTDQLNAMKQSAFLINTSRGPIVDQAALVDALHRGVIAGAGLDVLETEPPAMDDPILSAPNVLITPHIGFTTKDVQRDMQGCAVESILNTLQGLPNAYVMERTRRGT